MGTTTDEEEDRIRGCDTALGRDRDVDSETVGSGYLERDSIGLIGFASELERYRSKYDGVISGLTLSLVLLTTRALVGLGDFAIVNLAEGLPSLRLQSSLPGVVVVVIV